MVQGEVQFLGGCFEKYASDNLCVGGMIAAGFFCGFWCKIEPCGIGLFSVPENAEAGTDRNFF